jgi:hypothetical protein
MKVTAPSRGLADLMRQAIIHSPSLQWTLLDGHPCATSDFFFHDGDDRPVALIDPHRPGWIFLDQEDVERRTALLGPRDGPRNEQPERALEHELFREMSAAGLKVRRQVRVEGGVIDLLVDTEPPCIVEVKAIGDLFTVSRAAAQLWRYAQSYPGARLFVAAPPPILPDASAFLTKMGMDILRSTRDITAEAHGPRRRSPASGNRLDDEAV